MTSLGDFYTKDTPLIHEKLQVDKPEIALLCQTMLILCERTIWLSKRQKIFQKKAGLNPAKDKKFPVMDKVTILLGVR